MVTEVKRFEFVMSPTEVATNKKQTAQIGRYARVLLRLQDLRARILVRKPTADEIIAELESAKDDGLLLHNLCREMCRGLKHRPNRCAAKILGYSTGVSRLYIACGDGVSVKYAKMSRLQKDGWGKDLPFMTMSFMYTNQEARKNAGAKERFPIMNSGCAKFKMLAAYHENPFKTNEMEQHMFNICYNQGYLDFVGVTISIRKDPVNLQRLRDVIDLADSDDYNDRLDFLSQVVLVPKFKMCAGYEDGIQKWEPVKNIFRPDGRLIKTREEFNDDYKMIYCSTLNMTMEHLDKSLYAFSKNLIESTLKDSKLVDTNKALKKDKPVRLVKEEYQTRGKLRQLFLSYKKGDSQKLVFRIMKDISLSETAVEVDKKISTQIGKFQHLNQLKIQLLAHIYMDCRMRRPDVFDNYSDLDGWSLVRDVFHSKFNSSVGNNKDECNFVLDYITSVHNAFCNKFGEEMYGSAIDQTILSMARTSCVDDVFLIYDELDEVCNEFLEHFEEHENPKNFLIESSRITSYKNNDFHQLIMECCQDRRKEISSKLTEFGKPYEHYRIPKSSGFLSLHHEWRLAKVS